MLCPLTSKPRPFLLQWLASHKICCSSYFSSQCTTIRTGHFSVSHPKGPAKHIYLLPSPLMSLPQWPLSYPRTAQSQIHHPRAFPFTCFVQSVLPSDDCLAHLPPSGPALIPGKPSWAPSFKLWNTLPPPLSPSPSSLSSVLVFSLILITMGKCDNSMSGFSFTGQCLGF